MTTNGHGGVERATHELLIQHARTDTPTPFTTEGTLGHAGMLGGGVALQQPKEDFAAEPTTPDVAALPKHGPRLTWAARAIAKVAAAPFRN